MLRYSSCLLVLAVLNGGCSWTRYDDVVENSPIVLLNAPKDITGGFGTSMATGHVGDDVTLLVGGTALTTGAAEFGLGVADSPTLDARDTGHCMGGQTDCYFSNSPVALTGAASPGKQRDLCFVDGAGLAAGDAGIVVRCTDDDVEYALDMPEAAAELLEFSLDFGQATLFRFGADTGPGPALLATAQEETAVWYYPPLSRRFVDLRNPEPDSRGRWEKDLDRTLGIARVGDKRVLAVGIPIEGSVRLFVAEGEVISYVGCLGGTSGFGRAFATGPVLDTAGDDALVVSDDAIVYVFDAAKLAALEPTTNADCSLGSLPEATLITSFTCGSTKNISDCDASDFGAALGVGDLDGDGDGEVVVGAPKMTVRHTPRAGAVVIYDIEPPSTGPQDELFRFKDIAFISSADEDDRLGSSIALPQLSDRQVLAAGAPGGGKAALFYCPSFLPKELAGARCQAQ